MSSAFEPIKGLAKKSYLLRKLVKSYRLKRNQPNWAPLIEQDKEFWTNSLKNSENGKRILIPTSVGNFMAGTTLESLLAIALTLRGARTDVLLCDSALPACFASWIGWHKNQKQFAENGPAKDLCKDCFTYAYDMYKSLGINVYRYSEFLSDEQKKLSESISQSIPTDEIEYYKHDGISVGEHALAGALRFYARGNLDNEPYSEQILRRYFKAALLTSYVTKNIIAKNNYDTAVFNHGIYVPQGIIGEVCRKEGIHVVNWNPAYKKKCFIFSHYDTYHRTMITEPVENWSDLQWNDQMERDLLKYLKSRWKGTYDWIWFHERPIFNMKKIARETCIDFTKPCIGMLTSVKWDAQIHYSSNAFKSMMDWVYKTIDYFKKRTDLQLIIRVHPAEVRGTLPSRQKILDEIMDKYAKLPKNIIIIPPESNISTYQVMAQCDSVIIYNTKMGVELSALGIPVIVTGEAWIRNKGFAIDVKSEKDYLQVLDKLPFRKKMSLEDTLKAKMYAYHFFFRRMIPLDFMEATGGDPPYRVNIESLKELRSGNNPGLDVICNGILNGTEFIYSAEEQEVTGMLNKTGDKNG